MLSEEGIVARTRFDPGKCQKERFAPLPAIFLADLPAVLLAGLTPGTGYPNRGASLGGS